jgi:predicted O-methyltransferase YrrM
MLFPLKAWRRIVRGLRGIHAATSLAAIRVHLIPSLLIRYALLRRQIRRAGVGGFCPPGEGFVLFALAHRSDGPIVELGSAEGLSTIILASTGRDVTTVDTHDGRGMTAPRETEALLRSNLMKFGAANVTPLTMTTAQAAELFDGPSPDLIYVDALHTREGVEADIDAWLPHLQDGGLLLFDDYADPRFGVREAVETAARNRQLRILARPFGYAVATQFTHAEGDPSSRN